MTDQQLLIRAILEYPDDPTPRLIYADWLEEYGHSCGVADWERWVAFIREEDEMPLRGGQRLIRSGVCNWRRRVLKRSIVGFPVSYRIWDWVAHASFSGTNSTRSVSVVVRHGFIEEITVNQRAFIRMAKGLFSAHPVRQVWLTGQDPEWGIEGVTLNGSPVRFAWLRFGERDDSTAIGSYPRTAVIPPIWDRLKRDAGSGRVGERYRIGMGGRDYAVYLDKAQAYTDLSQAAVAWGRSLAGLPAEGVMA